METKTSMEEKKELTQEEMQQVDGAGPLDWFKKFRDSIMEDCCKDKDKKWHTTHIPGI